MCISAALSKIAWWLAFLGHPHKDEDTHLPTACAIPRPQVASPTSQSSTLSGYEGVAHQLEACHQEIKQLQAALAAREADSAQRLQQAQVCV